MKRGGPLRRVSQKRLDEHAQRLAVIEEVRERDGNRCYAEKVISRYPAVAADRDWPRFCGGRLDAHEIIQRSVRPGGHLEPANVRLVCRIHHEWIDRFQITAKTLGLSANSWEPIPEPVRVYGLFDTVWDVPDA